ncbi:MAG: EscU/YscU/HrcU family type III secretion system export apparatus switch protein [Rhodobacteraceae bacterium]|nr:EscU/YscU/HrcU family type III secretion system export apparatus switch protein [Paracoccaceae bacterium]
MAEGQDAQEKTEEPTAKRREDARQEGQIVTSTEVFVLVTLSAGALMFLTGRSFLPAVAALWSEGLVIGRGADIEKLMMLRLRDLLIWTASAGTVLGLPPLLAILAAQASIGGLNVAPKALMPKVDKINPLSGLKRMFSMKALVELAKASLKVILLLGAGLMAVWPMFAEFETMSGLNPAASVSILGTAVVRLLGGILCGLLLIAAIDLAWQIHSNTKRLLMSRQEMKDEMKEAEGSPEQKAEQRRRQREAAQRATERKALADVPTATAIVTNPTHFAVALRYDREAGRAPVIVAMGKGPIAKEVIRRGRLASIKTLRVPPLSRALYFNGAIGEEIPEALYTSVAVFLAHVWRLDQGLRDPIPAIDLPNELLVDEFGRNQKGK